jgi:hypothetical protein
MMQYNQRIEVGRLRMGWFGRVTTMLLAAAVFVLLFGLVTLIAAMAAAAAVVIGVKIWWQRYLGSGRQDHRGSQGRTLEAEYEVLSFNSLDREDGESVKRAQGNNDAGT